MAEKKEREDPDQWVLSITCPRNPEHTSFYYYQECLVRWWFNEKGEFEEDQDKEIHESVHDDGPDPWLCWDCRCEGVWPNEAVAVYPDKDKSPKEEG